MPGIVAELVFDSRARLGEGIQLFPDQSLWWVDIPVGEVHRISAGQSELVMKVDGEVSKALPWEHGFLVFGREEIKGFTVEGNELFSFPANSAGSGRRCSDATNLPDGSIVFGTVSRELSAGEGSLFALTPDLRLWTIETGVDIPNGLGVAPGGKGVLWVDSTSQTIFQFSIAESGSQPLVEKKVFGKVDSELGVPDGLAVDADGGCWVALWGGGKVVRLDDRGKLDVQITIPTPNPTSCAFDSEDNLWITTATEALSASDFDARGAGGIWIVPASAHGAKGLTPQIARLNTDSGLRFHGNAQQPFPET